MSIYSVDVRVAATAYIRAASAEEALAIARTLTLSVLELPDGDFGEVTISGAPLEGDGELPDLSLSPAMTIHGPADNATAEVCDEDDTILGIDYEVLATACGWKHDGDCGGFWFHAATWDDDWKAAASWSGTDQEPNGPGMKPATYATAVELFESGDLVG